MFDNVNILSPGQTRTHCSGNIMLPINVFLFAHLGKHCCGNINFSKEENMLPNKVINEHFCCGNNVSRIIHVFSNVFSTRTYELNNLYNMIKLKSIRQQQFVNKFKRTRRLQRRSLRLPTRSKSAQTGHLCTTAQAGADPGIWS